MNSTTRMALEQAVAHHRAGRLDGAIALYDRILALDPRHADANHLRGVAAMQQGAFAAATPFFEKAIALDRRNPDYLMNYATCLQEMGAADKAIPYYRKALQMRPGHPETTYNLGNTYVRAGLPAKAIPLYRTLLRKEPANPVLRQALGLSLIQAGEAEAGIEELRAAVAGAPGVAEPVRNLALALRDNGRGGEAAELCTRALDRFPDHAGLRNLAGLIEEDRGNEAAAAAHYRKADALAPDSAEPPIGLGNLARRRGDYGEAKALLEEAIRRAPRNAVAHNNLANALFALGEPDPALRHYREAVTLDPAYADGWSSFGVAQRATGDPNGAVASFDRAIAIEPLHRDARMGRAVVRLLRGRFTPGWEDYLCRNSVAATRDRFDRARLPDDLAGRRVLIERDQGLGDEIFFLRFAAGLRRRGASTLYCADERIAAMIARAGVVDAVMETTEDAGRTDLRLSVGDLPFVLGMGDGDPVPAPFAIPPLAASEQDMKSRLAACGPPPWIGVTWRAGTGNADRLLFKAAPADGIARAVAQCRGTVIAVQREPRDDEIADFAKIVGRPVHDFTALNADLEAMLALMGLLDVYVGVSNTNVHLRAARGRASHVLVPYPAEFRWMEQGDRSPWFPDCPVYRQASDGSWDAALPVLARNLKGA